MERIDMDEMHDPFAGQVACARYRAERDALAQAVQAVCERMEVHCLGVEGMDGSPVASWTRDLRAALGSLHAPGFQNRKKVATSLTSHSDASDVTMSDRDLLSEEERRAITWVRVNGSIDEIRTWEERDQERIICLLRIADAAVGGVGAIELNARLDEIAEAVERRLQAADGLRAIAAVVGECLYGSSDAVPDGITVDTLRAELNRRLMPEGMEWLVEAWPCFEDGEPVRFLDDFERDGDENGVSTVTICLDGSFELNFRAYSKGERVKRPAPKVRDADGAEIREGDTVWRADNGKEYWVRKGHQMTADAVVIGLKTNNDCADETVDASVLTHRAPVLAADGRPLREGETVWHIKAGREYVVVEPSYGKTVVVRLAKYDDAEGEQHAPDMLTHERPDSWKRWREEWQWPPVKYCKLILGMEYDHDTQLQEAFDAQGDDLVRRAKALAEKEG